MKVIQLLDKIANGELKDKAVVIFKSHECSTIFHKKDSRFEFSEKGDWNNYFYGIDIKELNDEVEIIEEPKEELEKLEEIEFAKAGDLMITIINKLIENQNKIIRELKVNK